MIEKALENLVPRVTGSLPDPAKEPSLLSLPERHALAEGTAPYLWAVALGRLLRWRDRGQIQRDLTKACRNVQRPEAARVIGDGCTILQNDITDLLAVLRGEQEGPRRVSDSRHR